MKLLLQDWPALHPLISDIHNDPKMHISIASCKAHLTLKTGCKLDGGKGNIWNKLVYSMHIKLITVSVISWFVLLACGPWLKKSEACHNFSRLLALRNSAALSQVLYRLSLTDRSHPVSQTACLPGAEVRITLLLGWLDNVGFKTNHIWKLGMRRAYLHSNTKHILELSYMQKSFSGPACRNQTFSNRFARSLMTLPRCTRAIKILWRSHGEWRYTHKDMDM